MPNRPVGLGLARAIKSVQRGTISIASGVNSNTATITAVNTAKSEIAFLGFTCSGTEDGSQYPKLVLTNATTVTADRINLNTNGVTVSFQVTEWY